MLLCVGKGAIGVLYEAVDEQVDLDSWIGAYRRICDAYAGDIMPSETESAYISMCRERPSRAHR